MGLQQIELVLNVEDEFDITIDDSDADGGQSLQTVGQFYDLVLRKVQKKSTSALARRPDVRQYVWDRVVGLAADLSKDWGPEQIRRDTRFVEDLGYG